MLITVLIIAGLFITANLIFVTPAINIENEPLPISRPTDVKKLSELEQLTATGWANGNGALVASAFTEKADFVTFNGEWYKSRQEIEKSHQKLFDGVLKGSTIENRNIRSIRFLNSTTAIVHVTGAIKQKWRKIRLQAECQFKLS